MESDPSSFLSKLSNAKKVYFLPGGLIPGTIVYLYNMFWQDSDKDAVLYISKYGVTRLEFIGLSLAGSSVLCVLGDSIFSP